MTAQATYPATCALQWPRHCPLLLRWLARSLLHSPTLQEPLLLQGVLHRPARLILQLPLSKQINLRQGVISGTRSRQIICSSSGRSSSEV